MTRQIKRNNSRETALKGVRLLSLLGQVAAILRGQEPSNPIVEVACAPLVDEPKAFTILGDKIQGVFTDLDGTLWYPNGDGPFKFSVPDNLKATCERLQKKAPLFIATGRPFSSVESALKSHKLEHSIPVKPGIYSDGHVIYPSSTANEPIQFAFSRKTIEDVAATLDGMIEGDIKEGKTWSYALVTKDGLAQLSTAPETPETKVCSSLEDVNAYKHKDLEAFYKGGNEALYLVILGKNGPNVAERLQKSMPDPESITYRQGHADWVTEVIQNGVTKSSAAKMLCDLLKLDKDRVMVIGDDYNDFEMIRDFKHSVAMGTAPELVKAEASLVVKSAEAGGWAEAIKRIVEGQPETMVSPENAEAGATSVVAPVVPAKAS